MKRRSYRRILEVKLKNAKDMTQKEFEEKVNRKTTPEEYLNIETLYYASLDTDKDKFCEDLTPMLTHSGGHVTLPYSFVQIARQIQVLEEENGEMRSTLYHQNNDLADFLIGKAHAYDDTDFRNQAVKLVGETEVVKRTIELGLPLWDEDRKCILSMIDTQSIQKDEVHRL